MAENQQGQNGANMEQEPQRQEYGPVSRDCAICKYPMELDDVAVPGENHSICLGCYGRETDTAKPMPKHLRKELQTALNEVSSWGV